jgi:hypothetical protein
MQQLSQSSLCQAEVDPQRQHRLAEGIIALSVGRFVHLRALPQVIPSTSTSL